MHIIWWQRRRQYIIFLCLLVVYASGGVCKSGVQAAYRSGCHLLRLVCISGLRQQSHVLALSLLLFAAGDVEKNPGPLDGRCAINVLSTNMFIQMVYYTWMDWRILHFCCKIRCNLNTGVLVHRQIPYNQINFGFCETYIGMYWFMQWTGNMR